MINPPSPKEKRKKNHSLIVCLFVFNPYRISWNISVVSVCPNRGICLNWQNVRVLIPLHIDPHPRNSQAQLSPR